jgi:hypothetical protein
MDLNSILYEDNSFTDEDQQWILQIFSHPTMKKYLKIVARNDLAELATISTSSLSNEDIGRKHSLVQGKLSTIVTLLNIQKPKESQS